MTRSIIIAAAFATSALLPSAHADSDIVANFEQTEPTIPVWQPKGGEEISFLVRRNGSKFGSHDVSFEKLDDGTLRVENDILLRVKFGPITAYNYEHQSEELWSDGSLVSIEGETRKERSDFIIDAERVGDVIQVNGTVYSGEAPASIIPSSHWNIRELYSTAMLSSEGGQLLPVSVEKRGVETLSIGGKSIEATRYTLSSDLDVDLWYDAEGHWVKCAFQARNQNIVYELQSIYW